MVYAFILKSAALALTLAASANAQMVTPTFPLTHESGSEAVISLVGCQVTVFHPQVDGYIDNILFRSEDEYKNPSDSEQSGITIMWPNIVGGTTLPLGGFARNTLWTRVDNPKMPPVEGNPSVATFTMESSEKTLKFFPYHFKLTYMVRLFATKLETVLYVQNMHSAPFEFQALLTNNLYVVKPNSGNSVSGLKGTLFYDKFTNKVNTETRNNIPLDAQIDNVYVNTTKTVSANLGSRTHHFGLQVPKLRIDIEKMASTTTDTVKAEATDTTLLNPTKDTKDIGNIRKDEYLEMVAIGSGKARDVQSLAVGATYTLQQTITVSFDGDKAVELMTDTTHEHRYFLLVKHLTS